MRNALGRWVGYLGLLLAGCAQVHGADEAAAGQMSTPRPAAAGGAGARAAGSPAAVSGSGAAPGSVACGSTRCMAAQLPAGLPITRPAVCCANANTSTCGTLIGGACMPPPPRAPLCPQPMLAGVIAMACCVVATNRCGIDASQIGMGCVSINTIPGLKTPPTRCDGTPAPDDLH